MGGMGAHSFWIPAVVAFILLSGYAYIVLSMASKDTGMLKTAGKVIGWALVLVSLLALIGGIYGGMKMRDKMQMMDKGMMPMMDMKSKMMEGKMNCAAPSPEAVPAPMKMHHKMMKGKMR